MTNHFLPGACLLLFFSGAYPLRQLWRANRRTSLRHAVVWALVAWFAWAAVMLGESFGVTADLPAARYLALALTGCAGVAVLGARRPGMAAWNFVVLGLLSVFLLPLAQGYLTGSAALLGGFWKVFLAITLGVGLVNYLFTRLALGAALLAAVCILELVALVQPESWEHRVGGWLLAMAPWLSFAALRIQRDARSEFDRCWLEFRNRFGLIWAQRLREQFNRSAANAGWPVELAWSGLRRAAPGQLDEADFLTTLRALMKRFGVA